VTVGYGEDEAMFDSWGDDVEWWDIVPPRGRSTPFRIFYPDEYEIVPRVIVDVMAPSARGACGLGTPRRVAPTTIASAVKSTISGQKAIRSRNSFKIGSRVLPLPSRRTVDELATFAIGWSSRSTRTSVRTSNPRTRRAVDEAMAVSLLERAVATRCSQPRGAGMKST